MNVSNVEMGVFVFVYEYPRTGGVNDRRAPWGWMVHSPIHRRHGWRDSTNGSAMRDPLATLVLPPPARSDERITHCGAIGRIAPSVSLADWLVDCPAMGQDHC